MGVWERCVDGATWLTMRTGEAMLGYLQWAFAHPFQFGLCFVTGWAWAGGWRWFFRGR